MQKEQNVTDLQLVERVKAGERMAFSELVKRHQRSVLRLSLRFTKDLSSAEDVTQEAFIKAYEKLNLFEGRASFKSWLLQIAVNTAKNRLREWKRETVDIQDVQLAVGAEAETSLIHSAVGKILNLAVEELPLKQRTALILRVYEDLSFAEIADVMDCPYDTAKANYRHALLKLKEVFQSQKELQKWSADVGGFFMEMKQTYLELEG